MTRLMIVAEHLIVREGLKAVLAKELSDVTFFEAWDAESARNGLTHVEWDAIILEVGMPSAGGLELLREFQRLKPATPVVSLSIQNDGEFAVRALRAGAASYLPKESVAGELKDAVMRALEGRRYINPRLAEKIVEGLNSDIKEPHETLSDREYLIMCQIGSGKPMKQIASELHLSIKTVSTYRARLLKKTGMSTNTELTRYVVERHLA